MRPRRPSFRWYTTENPPHARWHGRSDSSGRVGHRSHRVGSHQRAPRWARASVARSRPTRCSHGRCGLRAPAGLEPGSGWSTTTPPGLPAGIAAAKPPGQWCATHRIPDIDTGSFRPRLSRFSSFCRHTLHIAADCKHPSDTKLKTLGAPRIFGTIAAHRLHPGHTFLPITRIRKLIYTQNSEEPTKHE